MRAYRTAFVWKMLPSGPLVMVIVPGGADSTKTNTAPASTRTAKRITAMVMARLRPNISMIIVSRLGLAVAKPPALFGPVKSADCLSLLIGWQRRLPGQLEQGENPYSNNASVTAGNRASEMPSFFLALYVCDVRYILNGTLKIHRFCAPPELLAPTPKALAGYQGLPVRSPQTLHPSQLRRLRQRIQTSCFHALFHRPGAPPLYVCARRVGAAVAASHAQRQSPRSSALPTGA